MSNRPQLAVFHHHPQCSTDCCQGLKTALSQDFDLDFFGTEQFTGTLNSEPRAIIFPGGIGDADSYYDFFSRRQGNELAQYLNSGGKYVGICMGAYWAGSRYFDLLDNLDVVQYIKRPSADIRRSYATIAHVIWQQQAHDMFFYDGCTFEGSTTSYEVVATYAKGDPMAIVQGQLALMGCHPESQKYWYEKPYLKNYWHHGQHHLLLKNLLKTFIDA